MLRGMPRSTPALLGGGTTPLTFVSLPNKAVWPYMQQWHLDVQHDIAKNMVATLWRTSAAAAFTLPVPMSTTKMHSVPLSQNPYKPGEVDRGQTTANVPLPRPRAVWL